MFLDLGDYSNAVEELSAVFAEDMQNTEALCLLAETVFRLGQPEQALALFSDVLKITGPDPRLLIRISEILSMLGRLDESADFLMFASEAAPGDDDLKKSAVSALRRLGREEDALAVEALS